MRFPLQVLLALSLTVLPTYSLANEMEVGLSIVQGDMQKLESLLKSGVDTNELFPANETEDLTPLSLAVKLGNEKAITLLLDNGADISWPDNARKTPVMYAAEFGRENIVKLLLDRGADISEYGFYGDSPLGLAATAGNEAMVKFLLDHGADAKAGALHGNTALRDAVRSENKNIAALLIAKGADVNAALYEYNDTILMAAARTGNTAMMQLLIDNGAEIHAKDSSGYSYNTALPSAARSGSLKAVQMLLSKEPNEAAKKRAANRALSSATSHLAIVEFLLDNGASPQDKNTTAYSAIIYADEHVTQILLDNGANINVQAEDDGRTALLNATANGNETRAQTLLRKGADIHITDNNGTTFLMEAVRVENFNLVKAALEKGINVNAKSADGRTALDRATRDSHEDIRKLLLQYGAK